MALIRGLLCSHSNVEELADTAEDHEDTGDEVDDAAVSTDWSACQAFWLLFGRARGRLAVAAAVVSLSLSRLQVRDCACVLCVPWEDGD